MKKENTGKKNKWLWLVLGLVVLVAAVGVVLALVFGGQGEEQTEGGRPALYWNVDRAANVDINTGLSTREVAQDGNYYVRFACDGEQVEIPVADKKLVNYIDSMDLMSLTLDENGFAVDVKAVADVATIHGEGVYVQEVSAQTLIANTAITMNGRKITVSLTEDLSIYNVSGKGEFIGQAIQASELNPMDTVSIYGTLVAENSDEKSVITHVFVNNQPAMGSVYWRADQFYDSATKGTRRVPDENGVYTVPFYCDGETVELKFRDKAIVDEIDNGNAYYCHFSFEFDEEGYAVKIIDSFLASRTLVQCERFDITEINEDGSYTATDVIRNNGNFVQGVIGPDCAIYDVSFVAKAEYADNRKLDTLRLNDRVCIWTDMAGNPVLIYVTTRRVDSPAYYNPDLLYDSTTRLTTRTPNADGYYEIDLLKAGDTEMQTYYIKDVNAVTNIDKTSDFCVGLKVGEGNVVEYVYDMESVFGYSNFCRGYYVTDVSGIIASFAVDEYTKNGVLAPECKVWNVSTTGTFGEETTLRVGDYVYAARVPTGEIINVYIRRRMLGEDTMYWGLYTRMYDSKNKVTTREPDADGYYVYDFAHQGKQVTLKTKDKDIATFIDSYSSPGFSLIVKNGIILEANDGNYAAGGTKYNGWTVTAINGSEVTVTTDGRDVVLNLRDDVQIYNVSTAFKDHKGEKTTLRVGDYISAYRDTANQTAIIWVRGREVSKAAWPVQSMYDSATASTKRVPDAEGWYYIDLAIDGQVKTYKTKNKAIASGIDSNGYAIGVELNGDVIVSYASISYVKGVKGAGLTNYTVSSVKGNQITGVYTLSSADKTGDTQSFTLSSKTKIYDVSPTAKNFGGSVKLQEGDTIRTYVDEEGVPLYIYVVAHCTREGGFMSYCDHCDKVVYWNAYQNTANLAAYDGHYYLSGDMNITAQLRVYSNDRDFEIVFDLNGHTMTRDGGRAALIRYGDTLTVIDSVGGGAIKTDNTNANGGIMMIEDGTLNLYDGTLERLGYADETELSVQGGGLYIRNATFNMYGGTIKGGVVKATRESEGRGGNIYLTGATLNMMGGTIEGGDALSVTYKNEAGEEKTSAGYGGNICLNGASTVVNIIGGTITGGFSDYRGGNIYVLNKDIVLNIKDSVVSGGEAQRGGNIYSSGSVKLDGTQVIDGKASDRGGNIMVYGEVALDICGGSKVLNGEALMGGNIQSHYADVIIADAVVSGGKATGSNGGNICALYEIDLNINKGAVVTDGTAARNGGNIYLTYGTDLYPTLNVNGGSVTGGAAASQGDNIYADTGSHVNVNGGMVDGGFCLRADGTLSFSGAPVVSSGEECGLRIPEGTLAVLGQMSEGAEIYVNASGVFTQPIPADADAEVYCGYFKTSDENMAIAVTDERALKYYCPDVIEAPCAHCDGAAAEWMPWDGTASASSHYYLDGAMTMTATVTVDAGSDMVLDLKGNILTAAENSRAFYISGTMSVMDSVGGGALTGGRAVDARGGNVYINAGTFNLYSGAVTNGVADKDYGGNIYATNAGIINILGGTVSGGKAANGANVSAMYSTINISGGEIAGGDQTSVYATGDGDKIAYINISGGTLSGSGRNVRADNLTELVISGGMLQGETYARKTKAFVISGSPVIDKVTLGTDALITEIGAMEAPASVKISATGGIFTAELTGAAEAAAYFDAVNADYNVAVTADGKYLAVVADTTGPEPGPEPDTEACPHCAGAVWTAWDGAAVTSGHYFLTGDMPLADEVIFENGVDVVIDLRGFDITVDGKAHVLSVKTGASLSICDTAGGGVITGANNTAGNGRGGNIYAYNGTFNLYSGTIKGGIAKDRGGNIYATGGSAVVNLYGGVVEGGKVTDSASVGGNIYILQSKLTVAGDVVIRNGSANGKAPNVYADGTQTYPTQVEIAGGTFTGNDCNLYVSSSYTSLKISGGNLTGQTYVNRNAALELSGKPVIEQLSLGAYGMITKLEAMQTGASVKVTPTNSVFTAALADADTAKGFLTYIDAYAHDKTVVVTASNELSLADACPCGCKALAGDVEWVDPATFFANNADGASITSDVHLKLSGDFDVTAAFGGSKAQITAGLVESGQNREEYAFVTIDLNGYTWSADRRFYIYQGSELTVMDSSTEGTGVFTSTGRDGYAGRTIANYGTFHLRGGTLTMTKEGAAAITSGGVVYSSKGVVNMYGGTISGGEADKGGNVNILRGEFNMYGGTITDGSADEGADVYMSVYSGVGTVLNASGGRIGGEVCIAGTAVTTLVSGDIKIGNLVLGEDAMVTAGRLETGALIAVTKATAFTEVLENAESYLPYFTGSGEGKAVEVTADGKLIVVADDSCPCGCGVAADQIVWVDPVAYLDAAASGNYMIMENVHLRLGENGFDVDTFFGRSKQIMIGNDDGTTAVSVTVDLNGKTWSSTHRLYVSPVCTLTILDSSAEGTGVLTSTGKSGYAGRTIANYGTLNLRGGTVTYTEEGAAAATNSGVIYQSKGQFNMYGGTVTGGKVESTASASGKGGNVYVYRGTFNMYGGTISDGTATTYDDGTTVMRGQGGNVCMAAGTTFNQTGGTITGGTADEGADVYEAE